MDESVPTSFGQGRYRIFREIGRGGMAVVYLARDEKLQRLVVIKVPLPNLRRFANVRARFTNEWRIGARLGHPYAAQVFDIGEEQDGNDTVPFIVMEYIDGLDVEEILNRHGTIPARAASRITVMILLCLNVLHAQRVIHRDVKPPNIRLRFTDGVPKLMDFGVVHVITTSGQTLLRAGLTRAGGLIGTPGYMPLEQMAGEALDERTDLCAVATTLFVMLTGKAPSSMYELTTNDLKLEKVPELLRPIIIGATRAQRGDRTFANAEQMLEAIEAALARMPPDDSAEFYTWLREEGTRETAAATAEARGTIIPDIPELKVEPVDDGEGNEFETADGKCLDEAAPASPSTTEFPSDRTRPSRVRFAALAALLLLIAGGAATILWPHSSGDTAPPIAATPTTSSTAPELPSLVAETNVAEPPLSTTPASSTTPTAPARTRVRAEPRQEKALPADAGAPPEKTKPPEEQERGTFRVTGSADRVRLKGRGGTHGPGEVPAGTYTLEASFDGGATFVDFGSRTLAAGQVLVINCDKDFGNCQ